MPILFKLVQYPSSGIYKLVVTFFVHSNILYPKLTITILSWPIICTGLLGKFNKKSMALMTS